MTDVVWEDPPISARGGGARGRLRVLLAELKEHPGKWAISHPAAQSPSSAYPLKRVGCEVTSRKNDDGTYRVYARWPEDAA